MRRGICVFLILAFIASFICSCSGRKPDTLSIVSEFDREFKTGGRIYSTDFGEEDKGYISTDMERTLFPGGSPGVEYSLIMHSTLSSVSELCVFVTDDAEQRLWITGLAEERLALLSSFVKDGEGFVIRKGRVVAYGFFPNVKEAKAVLTSII